MKSLLWPAEVMIIVNFFAGMRCGNFQFFNWKLKIEFQIAKNIFILRS